MAEVCIPEKIICLYTRKEKQYAQFIASIKKFTSRIKAQILHRFDLAVNLEY